MEDVWDHVYAIKKEAGSATMATPQSILKDIFYQLPFFTCVNHFLDDMCQKDISKYLYCEETKTPPHPGSYGDLPAIWKEKHFLIKASLAILYQEKKDQLKENKGNYGSK